MVSAQGVPHLLCCQGLEVREVRLRPLRLASAVPSEQIRVKHKKRCVKSDFTLWKFIIERDAQLQIMNIKQFCIGSDWTACSKHIFLI